MNVESLIWFLRMLFSESNSSIFRGRSSTRASLFFSDAPFLKNPFFFLPAFESALVSMAAPATIFIYHALLYTYYPSLEYPDRRVAYQVFCTGDVCCQAASLLQSFSTHPPGP